MIQIDQSWRLQYVFGERLMFRLTEFISQFQVKSNWNQANKNKYSLNKMAFFPPQKLRNGERAVAGSENNMTKN